MGGQPWSKEQGIFTSTSSSIRPRVDWKASCPGHCPAEDTHHIRLMHVLLHR